MSLLDLIKSFLGGRAKPARINYPVYYYLASDRITKIPFFNRVVLYLSYLIKPIRGKFTRLLVNERIVEWPLVLSSIEKSSAKILDVGANESFISLHLASLGHRVTALDLTEYEFLHPNLKIIKEDIRTVSFPTGTFDYIIFLSTIEHVGLEDEDGGFVGARKVLERAKDWLVSDGHFILSVPYGKRDVGKTQRVYDKEKLDELLKGFTVVQRRYFCGDRQFMWIPCDEDSLEKVDSSSVTQGMCFVRFKK